MLLVSCEVGSDPMFYRRRCATLMSVKRRPSGGCRDERRLRWRQHEPSSTPCPACAGSRRACLFTYLYRCIMPASLHETIIDFEAGELCRPFINSTKEASCQ
ncbi:hypothetical protein [Piscinibacter sakaiensis]|uniref:hypothetical protein n=1 Tax=Piscinibacter sakaiensis TaxID=1547922 RepID=UPI003AB06558